MGVAPEHETQPGPAWVQADPLGTAHTQAIDASAVTTHSSVLQAGHVGSQRVSDAHSGLS